MWSRLVWMRPRLWEFAIMAILIGSMSAMLLGRLSYVREKSEREQVESVVHALELALKQRMGEMMIHSQAHRWDRLIQENPFDWLDDKPENYCGAPDKLADGCWVYDAKRHEISYRVINRKHFHGGGEGYTIRYQLEAVYPGRFSFFDKPAASSVELRLTTPYRWFDK